MIVGMTVSMTGRAVIGIRVMTGYAGPFTIAGSGIMPVRCPALRFVSLAVVFYVALLFVGMVVCHGFSPFSLIENPVVTSESSQRTILFDVRRTISRPFVSDQMKGRLP